MRTPLSISLLTPISSIVSQNNDHITDLRIPVVAYNPQNTSSKTAKDEIIPTERTTKIYRSRTPRSDEDSCPLDPNHTHFILLDDMLGEDIKSVSTEIIQSMNCRADLTIKPRTEIEHAISKSRSILIIN
jgi:hypothetical protein